MKKDKQQTNEKKQVSVVWSIENIMYTCLSLTQQQSIL
jgi:hypothetical protein